MTELEKTQATLIAKLVKQTSTLHYLMGRLDSVYVYAENFEQSHRMIDDILTRFEEMKGVDE